MDVTVNVYHHLVDVDVAASLAPVLSKLDQILSTLQQGVTHMSAELDTLTAKVTETVTVEQSAIELLNGLSAQIAALKQDPAALQALADSLSSKSAELAAAISANSVPS